MLLQEQINEICEFQASLSRDEEWLFFHLAWAGSKGNCVTYEDKYKIMIKWRQGLFAESQEQVTKDTLPLI